MVRQLKAELLTDAQTLLGECPQLSVNDQHLAVLDIERQELLRLSPQSTKAATRTQLTSRVSALAESSEGPWIAATETGFGWLDESSGAVTELISITEPASARMNDGAVDPYGRFWAGSASVDRNRRDGSLFMIDSDLEVHVMLCSVGMSNGLGWVNGGNVLLHVDTLAGTVTSYRVIETSKGPTLNDPQLIVEIPRSHGLPDGVAVDGSGAFWLALWGAGQVRRYMLDGRLDTVFSTGAKNTTSCVFGGSDLGTLFITSARQGVVAPGPGDGGVFVVTPGGSGRFSLPLRHCRTGTLASDGGETRARWIPYR